MDSIVSTCSCYTKYKSATLHHWAFKVDYWYNAHLMTHFHMNQFDLEEQEFFWSVVGGKL